MCNVAKNSSGINKTESSSRLRSTRTVEHSKNECVKFVSFVAYLQTIGIILVVLGHSFHEYPDGNMGYTTLLSRMIYSFHMPLFMFASGFLMVYTEMPENGNRSSFKSFAFKKIERLLIPFVVLSIVTFVPRTMMSGIADDQMGLSINSFSRMFIYRDSMVIPYFWFVQSCFTLLMLNYGLLWCAKKHYHRLVLQFVLVVMFATLPFLTIDWPSLFSFRETINVGVYFALGGVYAFVRGRIDKHVNFISPWFLLSVTIIWVLFFVVFENTPYIMLCSIAGIVMIISLAKMIERRRCNFLDSMVGACYLIFLLSWYFNVLMQQVLAHYVSLPWWVHSVLSLICGVCVPWLLYRFLCFHRNLHIVKVVALLLGQKI